MVWQHQGLDRTEPSASQASSLGQDSLGEGDKKMRPDGSQSSVVTEAEEEEDKIAMVLDVCILNNQLIVKFFQLY